MARQFNLSDVAKSAELTLGDIHASGKSAGQQATQVMSNVQNLSATTLGGWAKAAQDITYDISPSMAEAMSNAGLMPTGESIGASLGLEALSSLNPAFSSLGAGVGSVVGGGSTRDAAIRAGATGLGFMFGGPLGAKAANFGAGFLVGDSKESSPPGLTPSEEQQIGIDKAAKAEAGYAPEFDWGFGGKDIEGKTDPAFGSGDTTAPAAPMDFSDIPSDFGQDDPAEPVGDTGYDFGFDEPADDSMGGGWT